jgi:hypothetical protein
MSRATGITVARIISCRRRKSWITYFCTDNVLHISTHEESNDVGGLPDARSLVLDNGIEGIEITF